MVEIEGFEALYEKLVKLEKDGNKKAELLLILKKVAKPTLDVAKSAVPVQTTYSNIKSKRTTMGGGLKKSLGNIVGKKGNAKENPTIYIGPRVFKGSKFSKAGRNTFGDGWYGHMVDQGHDIYGNSHRWIKKTGRTANSLTRMSKRHKGTVIGHVAGAFFMQKAYSTTAGMVTKNAESATAKYFQKRIDKMSEKYGV